MPYVIDGNNLTHAVRKFEEYFDFDQYMLCKILQDYFRRINQQADLVFDGLGPMDKRFFYNISNPRVRFVGQDREADDEIEFIIEQSTHPKNLYVVSSDRRLRDAARARKAQSIVCEDFWMAIVKTLERKPKHKPEPGIKYHTAGDIETEYWMKEFGFNDDDRKS